MNKVKWLAICACMGVVCALSAGCGSETLTLSDTTGAVSEEETAAETEDEPDSAFVFVCGAVECEGVYELEAGSRKSDALAAAGGYLDGADTSAVNLAEEIADGERIYFPYEGEAAYPTGDTASSLVNINTADEAALTALPGIGETRAERIVEYRQSHGAFADKTELKNVSGIGESIYEGLEDYITVE